MFCIPEIIHIWYYKAPYGKNPPSREIPPGRQDIEVILSGRGFFEHDGRIIEAVPGTILWHGPGESTLYLNDFENPYECMVVSFTWDENTPMQRVNHWPDKISLQAFADNIFTEYHRDTHDLKKLAYYIYGQLYWHCKPSQNEVPNQNKRYEEIQQTIHWIDQHFSEDLTIEQLAKVADLSVSHLHKVFKEVIHQTPFQFIQTRRIVEAKKLLASTRLSVKEICAKSGFNDLGHFCRLFKRIHGVTAQEYRFMHTDKR